MRFKGIWKYPSKTLIFLLPAGRKQTQTATYALICCRVKRDVTSMSRVSKGNFKYIYITTSSRLTGAIFYGNAAYLTYWIDTRYVQLIKRDHSGNLHAILNYDSIRIYLESESSCRWHWECRPYAVTSRDVDLEVKQWSKRHTCSRLFTRSRLMRVSNWLTNKLSSFLGADCNDTHLPPNEKALSSLSRHMYKVHWAI